MASLVTAVTTNADFWRGRRVFLTGHTGFKGGWLALWLSELGAEVTGFALAPPTTPNLYAAARIDRDLRSVIADIRDAGAVRTALLESRAEIVFHCAAQSLVRASYEAPVETFATNIMGTVHLLDAIRSCGDVQAAVIVTSDKCYDPVTGNRAYVEGDRMGGRDPYSSSKGCAELVTTAFRASFFAGSPDAARLATTRAGNVIGGGDWAADRLVPDVIRACAAGRPALIRNPHAVRPWQHVLEPVQGYLRVAEALHQRRAAHDSWNFGPADDDMKPVADVVEILTRKWGADAGWTVDPGPHPPETSALRLDNARARSALGWRPRLSLDTALDWTVEWYRAFVEAPANARRMTTEQIDRYTSLAE